jgi:hypothetical protein
VSVAAGELFRAAEEASAYEPLKRGEELVATERYVLSLGLGPGPGANVAQRLRLAAGAVEAEVAEIRRRVRAHGGTGLTWQVSSAAAPTGLAQRLRALGAVPASAPAAVALALCEPPAPALGVTVARVETVAAFRAFVAITHEVFDMEERLPAELDRIDREGGRDLADRRYVRYLAWADGEPVAAAAAAFTPAGAILHAGATRAAARGRGAYRALVAARFADAAARGTPAVVTWAGAQSEPILRRLGFGEVGRMTLLADALGDPALAPPA